MQLARLNLLTFCCLFLYVSVSAQSDRLTPEVLWSLDRVSIQDVSPDGSEAVIGITKIDISKNKSNTDLYLLNVSDRTTLRLTNSPTSEYNARFHPDGNKIGFLREGKIFECDKSGKGIKQVGFASYDGFEYAPTGDKMLFVTDIKYEENAKDIYPDLPLAEARIIDNLMYRHWTSWEDGKYANVFWVPYDNGRLLGEPINIVKAPHDVPLKPFGGMEQIAWSPDGKFIAYTCKVQKGKAYAESTNSDIFLYQLETGQTINLSKDNPGYDLDPVFSPDGSSLVWNSMKTAGFEADRNRIIHCDLKTRKTTELTPGLDYSCNHPTWSSDGKKLYFTAGKEATYQLFSMDVSNRNINQITKGIHNYYDFYPRGEQIIARRASMSAPHDVFLVDARSGKASPLTQVNKNKLDGIQLGKVEKRMIQTTDGKEMLVWMIFPPNFDKNKQYPALLYCQGGPQSAVSQFWSYRWNFQIMAANDYVIVAPNRRGLPSFGRAWNDQISGDWGGQAMDDLLSAIDDAKTESYIDENRLGAVGASFGGYSVYWLAGNHNKRFKTFISHCGIFNMESWYGTTEELFFANQDLEGPYWQGEVPETYQKDSPHLYIKNWDTPLLVIHSEKDFRVPIGEGMQAFQAAQIQEIPSRFLYFPTEGHWVSKPQNGILWQRIFFDWLEKTLK